MTGVSIDEIKTIILAGGKGTRLYPLTLDIPKTMILIQDKPLLLHIIKNSQKYGFKKFIMKVGCFSDKIQKYFDNGEKLNCDVDYFVEEELLGTAGGLNFLQTEKNPVVILYGDELLNINLRKMIDFHINTNSQATLLVHKSSHPEDSDVVELENGNKVKCMIHKPGNAEHGNITNAGLYILNPECFKLIPEKGAYDFGKELLPKLISEKFNVCGYYSDEYIKDIGTLKRYEEAKQDVEDGKISNRVEAVFLDRDGTINEEVDLLHDIKQFKLLSNVGNAIKKLNDTNIISIIVTNQPVVARGLCDESKVKEINNQMNSELKKQGAYLDEIYYCPHHPEQRPEGNQKYRIKCSCRKPDTGMLLQAQKKFNLDLTKCFMIGDATGDILTGQNAGCKTILVKTGYGGKDDKYDVKPDYIFDNLNDAVEFVLQFNKNKDNF